MPRNKREATFEVRFSGGGVCPESVTLRAVNDTLNAVQDLASGRDPYETPRVDYGKGIGLVDVLRGSAVYRCVSREPGPAISNLRQTGRLIERIDESGNVEHAERLESVLNPIRALSEVARSLDCRIEVRETRSKQPFFAIDKDAFNRISEGMFVEGDTTIIGDVKRVGGATGMKCALRIVNRTKLLYCDVANSSLVRRLGQCLYQSVAARGEVVWIQPSWRIYSFNIMDFTQPTLGNPRQALETLRRAGLDAWDEYGTSEAIVEELGR